jgi:hypothetical protein
MQQEVRQEDSQIGYTWLQSEGEYYIRNPHGDLKRLSEDGLTLLQQLANGTLTKNDLPPTAGQLVEQLETENYLRSNSPVVELIPPEDIRIWPGLLIFLVLFAVSLYGSFSVLSASLSIADLFAPIQVLLFGGLMIVTVVIHESGHYLASKPHLEPTVRLGTVNDIIPAAITETTGAWMLPRNRRLWIHLAGPLAQLLWHQILLVSHYLFFPTSIVLDLLIISSISIIVFSFNPLIHGDGYWFLVDAYNVSGLRSRGINDIHNRELTFAAGYILVAYIYTAAVVIGFLVSIAYYFGFLSLS